MTRGRFKIRVGECCVDGCRNRNSVKGMCKKHYERGRRGREGTAIPLEDRESHAVARFWSLVEKSSGGCWMWAGQIQMGYGRFFSASHGGRVQAHRYSYAIANGINVRDLPPGMTIDHLCRCRSCVNPDHLELVTQRENTKRMLAWRAIEEENKSLRARVLELETKLAQA